MIWNNSLAHWEDPINCDKYVANFDLEAYTETYSGISEDGRDYIIRWKHNHSATKVEEHHILLPQAQWDKSGKPAYSEEVLSMWLDWDGDGTYGEWYLFPRGEARCEDALHFIWDRDLQTYKLYATGKERT